MANTMKDLPPLRDSLFPHVPPFLNYIPGPEGSKIVTPSKLREQLWRVPQAIRYILAKKGLKQCSENEDGHFPESVLDIANWKNSHDECPVNQFSNLYQLSRKDQLWAAHKRMLAIFDRMWGQLIPHSFILPKEYEDLKKFVRDCPSSPLWIVKPPNSNSGHGIQVVDDINSFSIKESTIVQKYISNPFLINGLKFDLRLYVMITSMDPLMIYLYGDGLVRFATQPYTNSPDKLQDKFIHLTNFDINQHGDFIYNDDPSERCGHKWRLKSLWKHLKHSGLPIEEFSRIWSRIKDMVIKSILGGLSEMREEFKKTSESRYNSYKLLGYDVILDATLNPYLLEVNTRPSVYMEILDQAVNEPMVQEMFKIVGYHIPSDAAESDTLEPLCKMFNITHEKVKNVLFERGIYKKTLNTEDLQKQFIFDKIKDRSDWVDGITDEFSPADVRMLIKSEEEFSACEEFDRIFPTCETHKYFVYFKEISYFDKLLDGIENLCEKNYGKRDMVIQEVRYCCFKHFEEGFRDSILPRKEKHKFNIDELVNPRVRKQSRLSCTNMKDLRKQIDEMGGFATLPKSNPKNDFLCSKLDSNRISKKIQYPKSNNVLNKLIKYDFMSQKQFTDLVNSKRIPLPHIKSDFLHINLTGDFTLMSLDPGKTLSGLDKLCSKGFRSFSGDFDQFLTTTSALSRQMLRNRLEKIISKISLDTAVLVGVCLGNNQILEKNDPEMAAKNLICIHSQIKEMRIPCFLISLCPVLANEARHVPYSLCWSSLMNYHLAGMCHQNNIPYLPIESHLFGQASTGAANVAAPTRKLVASRGVLGLEAKLGIGSEIVRYIDDCHSPTIEEVTQQLNTPVNKYNHSLKTNKTA